MILDLILTIALGYFMFRLGAKYTTFTAFGRAVKARVDGWLT